MPSFDLPSPSKAPRALHAIEGPCGPLAVWAILKHFHIRTSAARILDACKPDWFGSFTIVLAVALRQHGLWVEFYTDPDPDPKPLELEYYQRAAELGIPVRQSPRLKTIIGLTSPDCVPIIFYDAEDEIGHFSPVNGTDDKGRVLLPYSDERQLSIPKLEKQWAAPGICRQCILVRRDEPVSP